MPEIKSTFSQGKMNKDLDERIIPNGQYRHAMNVKVSTTDDSDVGVVQNVLGNSPINNPLVPNSDYNCIASIADEKTNKLYWFVTGSSSDAILEYDFENKQTKYVVVDTGKNVLKFTNKIITGVNIVDNILFFTDNNSEPKKINIDNCILGTDQTAADLSVATKTKLFVSGVDKGDLTEDHITVIKKSPKNPLEFQINETSSVNEPNLFEKVFPRFSYRYRYEDGQYSSFGPFTNVVFNSNYFKNLDKKDFYNKEEGYNTAMVNDIKSIDLLGFSSNMPDDVYQIQILYKEEGSNVVYSIKTINLDDDEFINNIYTVNSESLSYAVGENQNLRVFDSVPKRALSQEITGNRLVYGNYKQGYDLLSYNNDIVKPGKLLSANYNLRENAKSFEESGLPSLKSERDYQVGIVFGDKYGRETPVFTGDNAGVSVPWVDANTYGPLASQSTLIEFSLNSFLPFWADYYKAYVKETSSEYYNLLMETAYMQSVVNPKQEKDKNIYLSFASADRNKLTEEDYIILKRKNDVDDTQVLSKNKFKVLSIDNEAPEAIKFVYNKLGEANQDTDGTGTFLETLFLDADRRFNTATDTLEIDVTAWEDDCSGAELIKDSVDSFGDDIFFSFKKVTGADVQHSNVYKAVSVQKQANPDTYTIKLEEPIKEEDVTLADDGNGTGIFHEDIVISFSRKVQKDIDLFSGKFFVKISTSEVTDEEIREVDTLLSSNFNTLAQKSINYFQDTETTSFDPTQGMINAQTSTAITGANNLITHINSSVSPITNTQAAWASILSNEPATNSGMFFIDNVYMASGQSLISNLAKASGQTWFGSRVATPVMANIWQEQSPGVYDFTKFGSTLPVPHNDGTTGTMSRDEDINSLEGFITTDDSHTQNVGGVGYRVWKKQVGLPGNYPVQYFYGNENGKYYMHLSFLGPGVNLHDNSFGSLDETSPTKGPNGLSNYLQGIWGGGVFIDDAGNEAYMEGNFDASFNGLPDVPSKDNGQGYDADYEDAHLNQWNPTYENPSSAVKDFIDNLKKGAKFKFSHDSDETIEILSDVKSVKLYNHTPWRAHYQATNFSSTFTSSKQLKGDSVEEAVTAWVANPTSGNFNLAKEKIYHFGRRDNRRLVYIFEVDKDISQIVLAGTDAPNASESVDFEILGIGNEAFAESIKSTSCIWETEPREKTGLDIYYEASQPYPIYLNDKTNDLLAPIGSRIEILLNDARNGEIQILDDILVESWDDNELTVTGDGFNAESSPGSAIDYTNVQIRFFRKDGSYVTTRITSIPTQSNADYVKTFNIDAVLDASMQHGLSWHNCFSFGNGVESDRIRDDFNTPSISNGFKASTVLIDQEYKEEHRKNGLIYSGIYNSTSGVNNLNQFIIAENITKDLNPTYGSIQKLFQRRISLIAFCEDRVIGINSNKDTLFNADGNAQLIASTNVLGDATPFVGDYGISKNPESFVKEGYRAYFTDRQRGAVLRLSMDGITPISEADMGNYFKNNLKQTDSIIGTYDNYHKDYNLTLSGKLPGQNLIQNSSLDSSGSQSSSLIGNSNLILNPNITSYTDVVPATIDSADNIFLNEQYLTTTVVEQYPAIGIGELILETETTTINVTTNRQMAPVATFSDSVIYNQGFNPGNWGDFSDPNDPAGSWTDNGGFPRDPFSEKSGNTHIERQYTLKVTYDNRFPSATMAPFPDVTNSQTGISVNEDGDIWWYNGTYDNSLGFNAIEWPALQTTEPGDGSLAAGETNTQGIAISKTSQELLFPGEHRPYVMPGGIMGPGNTVVTSNTLSYIDENGNQPFATAMDTTVFNGEEVQIKFGFKNPVQHILGNAPNPRRIQVTLYNEWNSFDRVAVAQSVIFDEANSTYDDTDPDTYEFRNYYHTPATGTYENEGISGWDTDPSSTHRYAINPSVEFNTIDDSTDALKTHEVWFKFSDGTTDDKILVDNLQVGIKILDDNNPKPHGLITFLQIRKRFRLNQPEVFTTSTTQDGNPVPDAPIPAFALVSHNLSNWSIQDGLLNSLNWYDYITVANNSSNYGPQFNDLTTTTLTQAGTGATASYQFPSSGSTDNGVTLPTSPSSYSSTTNSTDDTIEFDNVTNGIILSQTGLSLTLDDYYRIDIVHNLANFVSGSDITIKSGGNMNGVIFVNNLAFLPPAYSSLQPSANVLRAIIKIDGDQAANGTIKISIPDDVKIQIESIDLIEINDIYTGGTIDNWQIFQDVVVNSYSLPSVFGSPDGIEFQNYTGVFDGILQEFDPLNPFPTTADGYEFKFSISNYVQGELIAHLSSGLNGMSFGGNFGKIDQDGDYSLEFNFDDNDMMGYELKRDGVSTGSVIDYITLGFSPGSTGINFHDRIRFDVWTGNPDGFVGIIGDFELIDLTNYFVAGNIDQFTIEGFDPLLNNYIDYNEINNDGQIVFNNSPITGSTGQVQILQGISSTLQADDYIKLSFEHDITSGEISGYYFNSAGKGFNFGPIDSTGSYQANHQLVENVSQGQLLDTFVIFVSKDTTSGSVDNIAMQQVYPFSNNSTITFNENVRGWTSFKSFIPEHGVSLSNNYFTFKNGIPYNHNSSTADRNTFYGSYTDSSVEVILNDSPSVVKSFNTLNYEGTQSKVNIGKSGVTTAGVPYNTFDLYNSNQKPGWTVDYIKTDKQEGSVKEFIEKEGKWFNYIKGSNTVKTSELSFQGLGVIKTIQTI